jgi:uncharacterized protein (DUF2249 family)
MSNSKIIITPKTKVLELIESYPDLEDKLISYVPAFEKLKNPLLRRTIAKVATLQQAALIGNVNISDLINELRVAAGMEYLDTNDMESSSYITNKPEWFIPEKVTVQFDVREMLERGEHPVNQVLADLKSLPEGEIYCMTASFLPAPLIDKASGLGFKHWVDKQSETVFLIYFTV